MPNDDLISRSALLAAYDAAHKGPPGGARKLIVEAPTVDGWISVKNELPEMYKAVLAFAPYHNNIWAVTMHEDGKWYIWSPVSKIYEPDWEGPITHWMPLPEPPKEDDDATN